MSEGLSCLILMYTTKPCLQKQHRTDTGMAGRENPDTNPHSYSHLVFDKDLRKKAYTVEKTQFLQQMVLKKIFFLSPVFIVPIYNI